MVTFQKLVDFWHFLVKETCTKFRESNLSDMILNFLTIAIQTVIFPIKLVSLNLDLYNYNIS
jgi:hypothetical protein